MTRRHLPFALSGFTTITMGAVILVAFGTPLDLRTRWDKDAAPSAPGGWVLVAVLALAAMWLGWRSLKRRCPK